MCLAIPGRILDVRDDEPILRNGRVDFGGIIKQVSLACVPEARVGQYVLVHAGLAINIVDETEAQRVFDYIETIGELRELEPEAT
ncbi:MAG: HypC/HybG/HupF family hydrogenase formation chaperone [Phycisphaerales bacterium]|nr:HypC/HybG/HupF family hydrogenase formation chaperone [Phycisphaerales bacterium]